MPSCTVDILNLYRFFYDYIGDFMKNMFSFTIKIFLGHEKNG